MRFLFYANFWSYYPCRGNWPPPGSIIGPFSSRYPCGLPSLYCTLLLEKAINVDRLRPVSRISFYVWLCHFLSGYAIFISLFRLCLVSQLSIYATRCFTTFFFPCFKTGSVTVTCYLDSICWQRNVPGGLLSAFPMVLIKCLIEILFPISLWKPSGSESL